MEQRQSAILDLTDCKTLGELHRRIKVALEFPDHYGENWSAFRDCMRFDTPVEYIKIVGEGTMPEWAGEHLRIMYEILQECKEERARFGAPFDYEIVEDE